MHWILAAAAVASAGLDSQQLSAEMASLARETLPQLEAAETEKALTDRLLVQVAAGDSAAAVETISRLRRAVRPPDASRAPVWQMGYELYARARLTGAPFGHAFAKAFHETYADLDDLHGLHASWFLPYPGALEAARTDLQGSLDDKAAPGLLRLTRYAAYLVARDLTPFVAKLQAEDDARRYEIENGVHIETPGGATLIALVVRPRRLQGPQPAALFFSIYTEHVDQQAFISAAHGYVGVVAFSRGKRGSPDKIAPYEREVDDVPATIDWIARQPWSDGRVGMYGGSYCGFTQWAAVKHLPKALKTIVPYVAAIPGQGLPMENNIFISPNYGWAFYVGNGPVDDDKVYNDRQRWNQLPDKWFESGRPYRELDQVDGTPNPLLQRWLKHPSYDSYWQSMVPYGADFAKLDIPILTVTGYYDDGQISALRYFIEHTRIDKNARHYLLIGPYDHLGAQRRARPVLRGYTLDSVALIDTTAITFEWFDHVFHQGPMPALLQDRVNYEVMGLNVWRHAPSLSTGKTMTLYLDDHQLNPSKPKSSRFVTQKVDLADRKTKLNDDYYPEPIIQDELHDGHGIVYVGDPLPETVSIDGLFKGSLQLSINKQDVDIGVTLYEKTPDGKYFALSYFLGRASYARDLTRRHLLRPGKLETVPIERTRFVSRQLSKGSRLVVVVNVNKNASAQVNMGTGKDVSDESIADAGEPLQIHWSNQSFIQLPIHD
jgi:putative CocE/NonD family hydrolase